MAEIPILRQQLNVLRRQVSMRHYDDPYNDLGPSSPILSGLHHRYARGYDFRERQVCLRTSRAKGKSLTQSLRGLISDRFRNPQRPFCERILTESMPVDRPKSEQKLGEHARLLEAREGTAPWRRWGPCLSERQWGTVREDYSEHGTAWDYFPHDHARSRAYRWGEDGLAGF